MNKKEIRKAISEKKKGFAEEELDDFSKILFSKIEENPVFQSAKTVMLYHSLPDEVRTHEFIEKWHTHKTILLPVVSGDDIILKVYKGRLQMGKGSYNIEEPQGEEFKRLSDIDMIIVPGVAFDKKCNRLGRGKGYYDRFLKDINAFKAGVCFDFQICNEVPTTDLDIPMDEVWTEKRRISKR